MPIPEPTHTYVMRSPREGCSFQLLSYRQLERTEVLQLIAIYRSNNPKPRRGEVCIIKTILGLR